MYFRFLIRKSFLANAIGKLANSPITKAPRNKTKTGPEMLYNSTGEKDLYVRLWQKSSINHVHEYRQIC